MSEHDPRPGDRERRDAERLRRFLEGEGGDPPAAEDAEVAGLLAEAVGAVDLPDGAWSRVAAVGPPARRRSSWRPVLALAAAALLAVGAVSLWPRGAARLPGPSLAEVNALGRALSIPELSPDARLAALGRVTDGRRGRLLGGGAVSAR